MTKKICTGTANNFFYDKLSTNLQKKADGTLSSLASIGTPSAYFFPIFSHFGILEFLSGADTALPALPEDCALEPLSVIPAPPPPPSFSLGGLTLPEAAFSGVTLIFFLDNLLMEISSASFLEAIFIMHDLARL